MFATLRRLSEHHRVLGLPADVVSNDALKGAFRQAAKRHHPDTGGDPEQFRRVCEAYDILSGRRISAAQAASATTGSAFYNHPHSRGDYRAADGGPSHGTERTRDDGGHHGMHAGARWANHQGRSANYSTRDFYRPYESGGGFTADEMNAARMASLRHVAYRCTKALVVCGCLVYMVCQYRSEDRVGRAVRARDEGGYGEEYWEQLRRQKQADKDRPLSFYHRKKAEIEETAINDAKRRRELGIKSPFDVDQYAGRPVGVTFRGQPFTPEGLAAARKQQLTKGGTIAVLESVSDGLSCELDDD